MDIMIDAQFIVAIATIVFVLLLMLILAIKKRHDIKNFFNPENYNRVLMIEKDNNIRGWLQPKNNELKFNFNGKKYEMYITDDTTNRYSQYRIGRNQAFVYNEGLTYPVNLSSKVDVDDIENTERAMIDAMSKLFVEDSGDIMAFLKKYGIYIIAAIVIMLILSTIMKGGG